MYKVELSFDTSRLNAETVEQLCTQTDRLFEQEDLSCAERQLGKRVYVDKGRKQDYGRFWAALFGLKGYIWTNRTIKRVLLVQWC